MSDYYLSKKCFAFMFRLSFFTKKIQLKCSRESDVIIRLPGKHRTNGGALIIAACVGHDHRNADACSRLQVAIVSC